MTPRHYLRCRGANFVVSIVLLGILSGCGSSPAAASPQTPSSTFLPAASSPSVAPSNGETSATPMTAPSPIPTTLASLGGPAAPPPSQTPPAAARIVPTNVGASLAGWDQGRVVVEVVNEPHGRVTASRLAVFDPGTHRWSWIDLPTPFVSRWSRVAADGSSVALASAGKALWVNSSGQTNVLVPTIGAAALSEWPHDGLVARLAGGYVAAGSTTLDAIAAGGQSMTNAALPAGYLMVAPTSDTNRFILARVSDVPLECGLPCASAVALWTRSTGSLVRITGYAGGVEPSSSGLAYLHLTSGWSLLKPDGKTQSINLPKVPGSTQVDTISPAGYIAAFGCEGGPGTGGPPALTGSCKLEIGKPGSTTDVAGFAPFAVFAYKWSNHNQLAILAGGGDWVGQHGMDLIIVDAQNGRVVTSAGVPAA